MPRKKTSGKIFRKSSGHLACMSAKDEPFDVPDLDPDLLPAEPPNLEHVDDKNGQRADLLLTCLSVLQRVSIPPIARAPRVQEREGPRGVARASLWTVHGSKLPSQQYLLFRARAATKTVQAVLGTPLFAARKTGRGAAGLGSNPRQTLARHFSGTEKRIVISANDTAHAIETTTDEYTSCVAESGLKLRDSTVEMTILRLCAENDPTTDTVSADSELMKTQKEQTS